MDQALEENNDETVNRCIEFSNRHISISFKEKPGSSRYQATFLSCFSASWVYSKVVTLGVSFLECEKRYGEKCLICSVFWYQDLSVS